MVVSDKQVPFPIVRNEHFDAAFVGLHPYGLTLLHQLRKKNPDCLVTIITADQDIRRAIQAMHDGAVDYLLTPLSMDDVRRCYCRMVRDHELRLELRRRPTTSEVAEPTRWVGESPFAHRARRLIEGAQTSLRPILITGSSGSGKSHLAELLAKAQSNVVRSIDVSIMDGPGFRAMLDQQQPRRGGNSPEVLIIEGLDCLPEENQNRLGSWLRECGSDEYNNSPHVIIVAHQGDQAMSQPESFRRCLAESCSALVVDVPALASRPEDIIPLAEHFVAKSASNTAAAPYIEFDAWERFLSHSWPGNVRELRSLCARAMTIAGDGTLSQDSLELALRFSGVKQLRASHTPRPAFDDQRPLAESKAVLEKEAIDDALRGSRGNVSAAARHLQISRTTLYKKCRHYRIRISGPYKDDE